MPSLNLGDVVDIFGRGTGVIAGKKSQQNEMVLDSDVPEFVRKELDKPLPPLTHYVVRQDQGCRVGWRVLTAVSVRRSLGASRSSRTISFHPVDRPTIDEARQTAPTVGAPKPDPSPLPTANPCMVAAIVGTSATSTQEEAPSTPAPPPLRGKPYRPDKIKRSFRPPGIVIEQAAAPVPASAPAPTLAPTLQPRRLDHPRASAQAAHTPGRLPTPERGFRVRWVSQANGSATEKVGTVVAVVPAGKPLRAVLGRAKLDLSRYTSIRRLRLDSTRTVESYLVSVQLEDGHMPTLYWPNVPLFVI